MVVAPQMYAKTDPLYDYKKELNKAHLKCQLFVHDDVNGCFKISAGKLYHKDVKEKFLTDGHFVLQRYTKEPAFIVWREAVLTLDNFISFDFDLEGASFFIYDLTYGYERRFELHTSEDNIATYEKLIAYLSERERMEQTLDTLRFSNLRTLEQVIQRTHQKIVLDVRSGKEKTYRI